MKARVLLFITLMLGNQFLLVPARADVNKQVLEAYANPSLYLDIKISPDGTYLASTSRDKEDGVIFLTVLDIKNQKVVSITRGKGKKSVSSFNWLNDERLLLTMAREVGSFERPLPTGELIAMDADGSNNTILTGWRSESGDKRFSQMVDFLPNEPDAVIVSSVDLYAKEPYLDLYKMKVSNGRKSGLGRLPLRGYDGITSGVITNSEGYAIATFNTDPNEGNKQKLLVRASKDEDWFVAFEAEDYAPFFEPIVLLDDDKTLVGLSSIETPTKAIATYNIETREHTVLYAHEKVDVTPILHAEGGQVRELLGAFYEYKQPDAVLFQDVKNKSEQSIIASLLKSFKGQTISATSSTNDGNKTIFRVNNANNPSVFYLFDKEARQLVKLAESRPWMNDISIPASKLITYKARDGQEISAVLTLPPGKSKNLPFVLLPHGGPHGVYDTIAEIDVDAKVLASHGYAVLQPNFRGSGGYGLDFLTAGFRKWGTTMIDDMTDGSLHLVKQGIVDKDRMCVYGGSYGGYAALQSVIREPDLYKCTIGFVGVYSLQHFREGGDIPTRKSGVNYLNRVLPEGAEQVAQSPVKNVDKIKVPVFIIQGEEDVRVPKEHAFKLRDELEKQNKPYEWMMKKGEGHGFYKPENNIERWDAMIKFLDKHTQ